MESDGRGGMERRENRRGKRRSDGIDGVEWGVIGWEGVEEVY